MIGAPALGETPARLGMCQASVDPATLTDAERADPVIARLPGDQAAAKSREPQMKDRQLNLVAAVIGDQIRDATHHEYLRQVRRDLGQHKSLWWVT